MIFSIRRNCRYTCERSGGIAIVSRFFYGPYAQGTAVAFHRRIFDRTGPFNEAAAWAQDFDMWLRVAAVTPWQLLPESTCITRVHAGQSTWHFPEGGSYD